MRIGEMTILGSHDFAKKTHMAVIARYMLQNYTCASLAGLADQLNYSLSYCSHFVLENTGFTFKQLLKKDPHAKGSQLPFICGYTSKSYC